MFQSERPTPPRETARGFAVQTQKMSATRTRFRCATACDPLYSLPLWGKLANLHMSSHYAPSSTPSGCSPLTKAFATVLRTRPLAR
jgi:hypothetical protein